MSAYSVPTYFAALNTPDGFVSYFKEIFGCVKTLYVIKGGSGTGKSRLMRTISKEAQNRGYSVEEYLCSSDPNSLDGLIIHDVDVAIIDGTAPHIYEPVIIGAKEHFIDLSVFLDTAALKPRLPELESLILAKKRRYDNVYSYLKTIRQLDDLIASAIDSAYDYKKMLCAVQRHAHLIKGTKKPTKSIRQCTSVSYIGSTRLDISAGEAKQRFAINDFGMIGKRYLKELLKRTDELGASVVVGYDQFYPEYPDSLYYPDSSIAFYCGSIGNTEESVVNMKRFVEDKRLRPYKPEIRSINKVKKQMLELLEYDFKSVWRIHGAIEEIYASAMDFKSKEKLTEQFINSIL